MASHITVNVLPSDRNLLWSLANALLGRPCGADCRGWFLNPHRGKIERPLPGPLAALLRPLVWREIRKLIG